MLYLSKGPDAFFYVGKELPMGKETGTKVWWCKSFGIPFVTRNGKDLIIHLSKKLNTGDLKWLSLMGLACQCSLGYVNM